MTIDRNTPTARELSCVSGKVLAILQRHIEGTPPWQEAAARAAVDVRIEELGISSAQMINVIIDIEDAFGIEVRDEHIYTLRTVGDVLRAVWLALDHQRAAS